MCTVVVTGFTGFVGKVVVEELCRQFSGKVPTLKIVLLIRSSKGKTAQQRFERLLGAICFSHMEAGWHQIIDVIEADLEKANLGLDPDLYAKLAGRVTHMIHCAASVDFDRPLQEAVKSNIDTSLNLLELARNAEHLKGMVATSTAYVHTGRTEAIQEVLAPLPAGWAAKELYDAIKQGRVQEADILRLSGHANTYTFTKCLAEHLLVQRHGTVPLSIVRPSIINVALRYPFPGFVDSYGSISGFGALFGAGFLHAMIGDRTTLFDLIPVDLVAQHLIDASGLSESYAVAGSPLSSPLDEASSKSVPITHCVAGLHRSGSFEMINSIGLQYFGVHREHRRVHWAYTGPSCLTYHWHVLTSQSIPIALACYWFALTGQRKRYLITRRLQHSVTKCNKVFPYFLSNTFDFVNSQTFPEDFQIEPYLWATAKGIHRHLIKRDLWQTSTPALDGPLEEK